MDDSDCRHLLWKKAFLEPSTIENGFATAAAPGRGPGLPCHRRHVDAEQLGRGVDICRYVLWQPSSELVLF
jgi:hypothetical protein